MAALVLLPGFGGKYTSETFTSSSAVGVDTIDCSHLDSLAIQVNTSNATGDIDIEQSFDLGDWAVLVDNMSVATDGAVTRLDTTDNPFGVLRINATGITAGTVVVTIVGFAKKSP